MNQQVDAFISNAKIWQQELSALRTIILQCHLTEEIKWRQPCYSYNGSNILIIGGFKNHCVLSFFKGALLQDALSILELPGPNSQAVRTIKFTNLAQIAKLKNTIIEYINQAIAIEKAGLKVVTNKEAPENIPQELQNIFALDPNFKNAFEALTAGRQRAYVMFFEAAKQANTRKTRIQKCLPRILDGFGLHDCTCGLSKRMPTCDGSHKILAQ